MEFHCKKCGEEISKGEEEKGGGEEEEKGEEEKDEKMTIYDITVSTFYDNENLSISDSEECFNYLSVFRERTGYFWCWKNSKLSCCIMYCFECEQYFMLPHKMIYRCIKKDCCQKTYCKDCYFNKDHSCNEFYRDFLYNSYHRYPEFHNKRGTKIEDKDTVIHLDHLEEFCSPPESIEEVRKIEENRAREKFRREEKQSAAFKNILRGSSEYGGCSGGGYRYGFYY